MTRPDPDDSPRIDATTYDVMRVVASALYEATGNEAITLKLTMSVRAALGDAGLVVRDVGPGPTLPPV